jgi:hypothetical protein
MFQSCEESADWAPGVQVTLVIFASMGGDGFNLARPFHLRRDEAVSKIGFPAFDKPELGTWNRKWLREPNMDS